MKMRFIHQNEANSPFICPYNIDFRTQHPKIDLSTKFRKFPFRGTIPPFSAWSSMEHALFSLSLVLLSRKKSPIISEKQSSFEVEQSSFT